jgi:hypothetical protein
MFGAFLAAETLVSRGREVGNSGSGGSSREWRFPDGYNGGNWIVQDFRQAISGAGAVTDD